MYLLPPGAKRIQCAANFSEGRDVPTVRAIVDAAQVVAGVRVADWSADLDHNRMVVTLVGEPEAVAEAAFIAATEAVRRIDLRTHTGVHPRLGAVDVVPFVPLVNVTMDECADIARAFAARMSHELAVPVFLYEAASAVGRSLPDIRKRAFVEYAPDIGPSTPHLTAGAVVVGARGPLIAFNADLASDDLALAKQIAREVREAYGGRVRTLGLALPSRGIVQVSMNVIRPAEVSLLELVNFIDERCPVANTELIGALPGYNAFDAVRDALKLKALTPEQVLIETWPSGR